MNDGMEFESLEPQQVPIWLGRKRLKDETSGVENPPTHVLKEASDSAQAKYKTLAVRGATVNEQGVRTVGTHVGELATFLLSQCLWECDEAGHPTKPLPESAIKNLPGRITMQLASKAEEISGLKTLMESPERKALIAALKANIVLDNVPFGNLTLDTFRMWANQLNERDPKTYAPLWNLIKPSEEEIAKNSQ